MNFQCKWIDGISVSATLWDAALVLAKHFETIYVSNELLQRPSLRVLELGAGCGALPSIVLRTLREACSDDTYRVTDKAAALPLLSLNLEENDLDDTFQADELDWTSQEVIHSPVAYDLIILSDALAFPELYDGLIHTLRQLTQEGRHILQYHFVHRLRAERIYS